MSWTALSQRYLAVYSGPPCWRLALFICSRAPTHHTNILQRTCWRLQAAVYNESGLQSRVPLPIFMLVDVVALNFEWLRCFSSCTSTKNCFLKNSSSRICISFFNLFLSEKNFFSLFNIPLVEMSRGKGSVVIREFSL